MEAVWMYLVCAWMLSPCIFAVAAAQLRRNRMLWGCGSWEYQWGGIGLCEPQHLLMSQKEYGTSFPSNFISEGGKEEEEPCFSLFPTFKILSMKHRLVASHHPWNITHYSGKRAVYLFILELSFFFTTAPSLNGTTELLFQAFWCHEKDPLLLGVGMLPSSIFLWVPTI